MKLLIVFLFLNSLSWLVTFLYIRWEFSQLTKKIASVAQAPHEPPQQSFMQEHAKKQSEIIKRAKATGRWDS